MVPDIQSSVATTDKLEQALIQKLDRGDAELSLLPQVASQVMALAADAAANAAKLSSLIHQDQALAAHVLRIANSAAYMPRSRVVSLQHAVAMLGINLRSEIAFTAAVKNGAFRVPGHEDHVKRLWRHSLTSRAFGIEITRAQISRAGRGLLKMIADPNGQRLLGVQVAGDSATELIHLGQMVLQQGALVESFIDNVFTFPTYAEAYCGAALDILGQIAKRQTSAAAWRFPPFDPARMFRIGCS